jgi:2-octaprenyl-6-methoxyphenol hydroxylase
VSDGYAGSGAFPFYMHFDHREINDGPMGYMLEDRFLRKVLNQELTNNPFITQFCPRKIINQKVLPGFVEVELDNFQILRGKLLVGSDGKSSLIRLKAGIQRLLYDYDQVSLVSAVKHELDHGGEAHQFFMPSGPLAILPLPKNRSSIVWTEEKIIAEKINKLSKKDYLDELRLRFGSFRGQIKLDGDRFSYPLSLSISEKIISNRLALIGDAAHAIHPVAGQGLNLGVRDIASLTEVIVNANRRGEDIGKQDVLEKYSSWRNFDRTSLYIVTHGVNRLFSNDNIFLRTMRDFGMGAINKIPIIKKGLIQNAAGLVGDLPIMMTGKKI